MSNESKESIGKLILVPAVITLAITLLRLTGELMNWSSFLFNKAAGGGGALIGIAWLVPIFGFYFARQSIKANDLPTGIGRVFGYSFLGIVVYAGLFATALQLAPTNVLLLSIMGTAAAAVGLFIVRKAWPSLFSTLFAYGLAARVPVAIVMFFAIMNNWGTHYDVPPPNFPEMGPFAKWVVIGVVPQLTFWIFFTVTIGSIFGGIAVAVTKRASALANAAS